MKALRVIVLSGCILACNVYTNGQEPVLGKPAPTAISKALSATQTIHALSVWELARLTGENDTKLRMDAVEYKALNQTEILKAIRVSVVGKELAETDVVTKRYNEVTSYIEDNEYSQLLVTIDNMIKDLQSHKSQKKYSEMSYITKGGIKIGYIFNSSKATAYLSIIAGQIEITNESTAPDEFLAQLKQQIDIVIKELYLPENAEKLKKVKKGTGETKDVNINDL